MQRNVLANFRVLLAGTGGAQIVGLLTIPLLTNLYRPAAYGGFASIYVVALTVGTLAALRYERAIVLAETVEEARAASGVAYRALASVVILTTVASVALNAGSESPLGSEVLRAAIVPGLVAAFGVYQIRAEWMIRNDTYGRLALAELIGVLVPTAAQVGIALAGWRTAESLLVGALVGRIAQFVPLLPRRLAISRHTTGELIDVARRYRSFALLSTPYSLISIAPARFVVVIASAYLPLSAVGAIAIAYRLTFLPVTTFANVLRRAYVPRLVRDFGTRALETETLILTRLLLILLVPLFIGLGILAPWLADSVLGGPWAGTGRIIQLFLPGAAGVFLTAWMDRVYEVAGQQRLAFLLEAVSTALILGSFWAALVAGASSEVAVATFAIGVATYNLVWLVWTWRTARFEIMTFVRKTATLLAQIVVVASISLSLQGRIGWVATAGIALLGGLVIVDREGLMLFKEARVSRIGALREGPRA